LLPSAFIDRMSYRNGDFDFLPWSLPFSRPASTPTRSRPPGVNARPLKPSKPAGAVYRTVRVVKSVPVKPLHCSILKDGPVLVR
jgi:hypothetical protein